MFDDLAAADRLVPDPGPGIRATSPVGAPVPRAEGPDKVTGHAQYAADVALPGMLWGKVLRSPYPHARILRIDASRAWGVPGVRAVVTGPDVAGHLMGKVMRDMPVLCWDRVRFVGDRVAAVAAETLDAAEAALDAIEVEYEPLPAVFDPLEAMDPATPLLHEDITQYEGTPPAERSALGIHNGQSRLAWTKGDPAEGFRTADLVLEHTFRIPSRHQGYLEPHACIVAVAEESGIGGQEAGGTKGAPSPQPSPRGRGGYLPGPRPPTPDPHVEVWASTKAPFRVRTQLAKAVGISEEAIRVNVVCIGGDFGGKGDALDTPIAYFLARQAGRPVKIVMTYAEELTASNPSHPTIITIRTGVTRDGRILARTVRNVYACGAYAAMKPNGIISAWHWAGAAYRVLNAAVEFLQVYTNTTPGGYFRAPGAHQYTFALESHTDLLAQELGMDPAEFRLRNCIKEGEEDVLGNHVRAIKARETLQAALDAAGWGEATGERREAKGTTPRSPALHHEGGESHAVSQRSPLGARLVGRGIGLFGQQVGGGPGGAVLTAQPDGSLTVLIPTFDQGSGTPTVMRQLVAAELGVPIDQVRVVVGATDVAPFDDGARASRVTYTEGQAVVQACRELRARLAEGAAELLDCRPEEAVFREGAVWAATRAVDLADVVVQVGGGQPVTITTNLNLPQPEDAMYCCAQVAAVEVDPETGQVRVQRLVTAHDVGAIINPLAHQGQIDGGVATGLGLALVEELVREDGRVTTTHLGDYKLPAMPDLPPLETVLVPSGGGVGPYGAKPIGELANNALPAAIANAVADATGVRLFELPINAERVLRALQDRRPGST